MTYIIENTWKYFYSPSNLPSMWLKILQNFPWSVHIDEKLFP